MATQALMFATNLPKKIQQCDIIYLSWMHGVPPYTIKAVYWPNEYGFRIDGVRSWDILTNTTETSYAWQAGIWGDSTVQMVAQDSAGTESSPAFYALQVDKGPFNTRCEASAPVRPDLAPQLQPRSGGFDWVAPQCPDVGTPTGQIVYMVDSPNQNTKEVIVGLASGLGIAGLLCIILALINIRLWSHRKRLQDSSSRIPRWWSRRSQQQVEAPGEDQ